MPQQSALQDPEYIKRMSNKRRRERLENLAEELFGASWKDELAPALRVTPRTVRRWISGETNIPAVVLVAVGAMLEVDRKVTRQENYG